MNLYYSLALNIESTCVDLGGRRIIKKKICVESPLKYHPCIFDVLTLVPNRDCGQCLVGSLTGAVSSQIVTEEHEGWLILVGHQEVSAMA